MKTVLRFLKPYKRLCILTLLTMLVDAAGALLIPTLTADMINIGVSGGNLNFIVQRGLAMVAVTVLAGAATLLGSWLCADLSAKVGKDMRNAVYDKSLAFSAHDFEQFGTGSMIARTLNDVNIIQQSIVWCIQMVIPVPALCTMGIVMAFAIDATMGYLLIAVTALIIVLAVLVTRKASVIFESLQRFLDRMNVVLRENITGVRVIRAFNKERREEARIRRTFEQYAESSIQANRLFVGLESLAFLVISDTWYQGLDADTQAKVDEAGREATIAARGICRYAEALAVDTMVANGVQVYSPTAEELETFKVAQEPVMEYLKKNLSDPTLVDSLFSAIETAETMEDGGLTASGGGTQIAAAASQRGTLNLAAIAGIMVVLMAVVFLCTRRKGNGMEE